ncbi:aldo/keto reductase family oxidoreductase [Sphingobium chlorophenolicum]|uniref:Aldo/keto reductase family protein n=1 Tax=Sphingobium chlorophenolicum TaxID=46429 RepID=A0A081REI2_SPHCR|nr:aldo/keto reductase family oxidoreductase [Sphingobium chlorophenolicum]KEQ53605.1 Aldo/keto reductase family protein [Sphingobium chlorophenolicum]
MISKTFPFAGRTVNRMGYGAMQLAGPGVFGPPKDHEGAIAVLQEAVANGINHIDTSDFYGPHITNRLIREALHPYPADLVLVTKVGAVRGDDGSWNPALSPNELRRGIEDNLANLGLDAIDVVNLRVMMPDAADIGLPTEGSIGKMFEPLAELRQRGLIRHLGLSNVTAAQVAEARTIAPVVCVQNQYNIAMRHDDALIDTLAAADIAYVPFFPLGGFSPIQSEALTIIAEEAGATRMQLALAWLLHRSPNILLIPGTSSIEHLRQNLAAAAFKLDDELFARLDAIGQK